MWSRFPATAPVEPRTIRMFGTGQPLYFDVELLQYLGTIQMYGGDILHVFISAQESSS
jgi:hypothetical protein